MKANKIFYILVTCSLLLGCQLTERDIEQHRNLNFAEYYLWLKTLSKEQLSEEFLLQQKKEIAGEQNAIFNLALIYTLPDTPTHNAYTAKAKLNNYLKKVSQHLSITDLALMTLLKDQLNQQLFLYQQLVEQEIIQQKMQRTANKQQTKLTQLIMQVKQLQQQINQLKKIEKTIQQRGQ